jgi:hypothetical protein
VQSSRRLKRECQRNIELAWLTGRLMPDFKTIADVRKDDGEAIRKVCREFVVLCRRLELFSEAERCDRWQQVQGRQHAGPERTPWEPARVATPVASPATASEYSYARDIPPGRLMLSTRPYLIVSSPLAKTIGIVEVGGERPRKMV